MACASYRGTVIVRVSHLRGPEHTHWSTHVSPRFSLFDVAKKDSFCTTGLRLWNLDIYTSVGSAVGAI